MKKFFYNKTDGGKMFLWSVLAPQLLGAVATLLLMLLSGSEQEYESLANSVGVSIIFTMIAQLAFALVYFVFNKKTDFVRASKINLKIGWLNAGICALIGIIGVFGLNPLVSVSDSLLEKIGYSLASGLPIPLTNFWWLIVNLILVAAVPAVIEELIFRGVILNSFKNKKYAVFISAALFALIHGSAQQLIFPFLFGLILAFVALKTQSVVSSMIIHFTNNAIVVILSYVGFSYEINLAIGYVLLIGLALAAATFAIVWFLAKLLKPKPLKTPDVTIEDLQEIASLQSPETNTPMILGVVFGILLWITEFIINLG